MSCVISQLADVAPRNDTSLGFVVVCVAIALVVVAAAVVGIVYAVRRSKQQPPGGN